VQRSYYGLIARDILTCCSEGSLLDVGTGPGWLLVKLHHLSPELRLTGLDVSGSMVARARKNMANAGLSEVIEIKEGNADCLPFADSLFDTVVSTGTLHHWKKPTAGLNEVHRVLKEGGLALMYDLVSDTPASILRETARQYGKLKILLLWLHAFEEPFYSCKGFALLARPTWFRQGRTRFVGVLCCLMLKK